MAERPMARTASMVMVLILLSRLLGLIRERAVAVVFGQNWQTDAFTAAFVIPDLMFFLLIGGGLNAAFIPVFTSYLARGEEEDGWRMAWTFFALGLAFLLVFAALGMIFTPALVPFVAFAFRNEQRALLIDLMRFMFPAVFFTALAGLGMGIHKSYKSFKAPLYGPLMYNAAIIAGTYALAALYGIFGMAIGTVVGAFANFAIQMPFFIRKSRPYPFRIDLRHPGIKQAARLMGPAMISGSLMQVNLSISKNLASFLPAGSIRALQTANIMVQFPLGVFAMGIGMVILPTLAGLMAKGEVDRFRSTFSEGLRMVLFVTIPSAVGLIVLRVPLIRLLFQSGEFGPTDTELAAYALLFYGLGLVSQAAIQILVQVYYSLQDTHSLVRVSTTAVLVNAGLSLLFLNFTDLGLGGLALAASLTSLLNMLNYLTRLRRHIERIDGSRIIRTCVLSIIAATGMAITTWSTVNLLSRWVPNITALGRVIEVGTSVLVGVVTYFSLATILRMEEIRFLRQVIKRRRSKPAKESSS